MKKKILKVLVMTMLIIAMLSTNVFAADKMNVDGIKTTEISRQHTYNSFDRTFTFYTTVWGVNVEMKVTAHFDIEYEYSEGNWYEIYYANIGSVSATVNGNVANVVSVDYVSNSIIGARRHVSVNGQGVLIYLTCDEWGIDYGAELE